MYETGFEARLYTMFFLGLGGAGLGLLGLLASRFLPRRWPLAGPASMVLLVASVAAGALHQPQYVWLPALELAGVAGLFSMMRSPLTRRALASLSSRLHPVRNGHPEQPQALGQHVEGERAEGEPAGPQCLGLRLEYRALLVERGEQAGHVEQVGA